MLETKQTSRRLFSRALAGLTTALLFAALAVAARPLGAQGSSLAVDIARPSEGETYYAGPATLLYNLPVRGWVNADGVDPARIEVRLEVFKGNTLIGSLSRYAAPDGAYLFFATVNPEGDVGQTPDYRFAGVADTCGGSCHSPIVTSLYLVAGALRVRVTATTPDGRQASVERNIYVDRSVYAAVPVKVVLEAHPEQDVAGIFVNGATRLYMWRGRHASAATGPDGQATLLVEALGGAPTEYLFRVEPTVVDGVWYEGIAPVAVTLPPGATAGPAVTLQVRARVGRISGSLSSVPPANLASIPVVAIHLPEGLAYRTATSFGGTFEFTGLPVGQYQVAVDTEALAALGLAGASRTLDLANNLEPDVTLALVPLTGSSVRGIVRDSQGRPLPFAWVSPAPAGRGAAADPATGRWRLAGLTPGTAVVATAPGFYSGIFPTSDAGAEQLLDLALVPRPETQRLPWGAGEIILPPETRATLQGQHIALAAGWLWGKGSGGQPITIETAGAVITVSAGAFALENTGGQAAWFYLLEGTAQVRRTTDPTAGLDLAGGEMLAMPSTGTLSVVPLDAMVVQTLRSDAATSPPIVWEPTLGARIRDRLALLGVTTVQAITFITYLSAIGALVVLSVAGTIWWRRRGRAANLR